MDKKIEIKYEDIRTAISVVGGWGASGIVGAFTGIAMLSQKSKLMRAMMLLGGCGIGMKVQKIATEELANFCDMTHDLIVDLKDSVRVEHVEETEDPQE